MELALLRRKLENDVEGLIKFLREDTDHYVRMRAATHLGDVKDKRVVEVLIQALRDESWEV